MFKLHLHVKLITQALNVPAKRNQLHFLDMYTTNDNGRFHTSIYHKATFTGLGLHFLSNTPYIYEISSIKALIIRAYNLRSNWMSLLDEINFLKYFFV